MRRCARFSLSVMRRRQPAGPQILWAMGQAARPAGLRGIGCTEARISGAANRRDNEHATRRDEASYRSFLRYRQLHPAHRTARAGRDARSRPCIPRLEPRRGVSLRRHAPQFTGDGFMALFGAPLTHEDHVRRALLAALAIQRALHEGGAMAGRELDELEVRTGIHTGPVVFGPVSDNLSMDYTVIGDTANVAAR